uniref:Uncharacterized protein n=1 Tax=Candidatus Kentrum sp. FW TaxID=2126338 RepID=A0A450S709_9GAMM|nr:MAG: hypothetical protein BECKFW1821A_GA0114235_101710 [Candidatus Kentron sp. FW]VFJ62961.1 MAG: hypothetical protein BECKFW1821B_GA0114236_10788 [Candidatus Kentron sp. FW]
MCRPLELLAGEHHILDGAALISYQHRSCFLKRLIDIDTLRKSPKNLRIIRDRHQERIVAIFILNSESGEAKRAGCKAHMRGNSELFQACATHQPVTFCPLQPRTQDGKGHQAKVECIAGTQLVASARYAESEFCSLL